MGAVWLPGCPREQFVFSEASRDLFVCLSPPILFAYLINSNDDTSQSLLLVFSRL